MTDSEIGIIATAIGVGIGAPLWRAGRKYSKKPGEIPQRVGWSLDFVQLSYELMWVGVFFYATWYVFLRDRH